MHPISAPVYLKASEVGPLEMIFFLKNQLPKSSMGTVGKIYIEIYPALPNF